MQVTIRILIADDHEVVRQGLATFLALDPELQVVAQAEDGKEAVTLAAEQEPDVILMDLLMPVMDGIAATVEIRTTQPNIAILILTSMLDEASVLRAMRAGANGYLLKTARAKELTTAIKAAVAGQVQFSPQAISLLLRDSKLTKTNVELSEREQEVLNLLAQGHSNKEIALFLQLAEKTVKTHLSNIFSKLGVQSRTQAILYAGKLGLTQASTADTLLSPEKIH